MDIKSTIKELTEKNYQKVVSIRRYLHQHPELSYNEHETSKYIVSILESNNIKYNAGIAQTGIVCSLEGKNPKNKVIALRADFDALPIEEENDLAYKSVNRGIMHACGHDAHTASLLGVVFVLKELVQYFEGTIKFIFQPAEEKVPGGAKLMIEEGVLNDPAPELIIAQHVYPELGCGKVGFKPGVYMASSDEIYITVKGNGGHAAMPEKITDTVLISSHIIVAMQQIVSRMAPPGFPSVLSFGKFIANGATNIIPNEVLIEGTFRTMNEEWRNKAHKEITKIATSIGESMGAMVEVNILNGYPVLVNHVENTLKAMGYAREYLGEGNVEMLDFRRTSEDFAHYSQKIPATFYRFGTASGPDSSYPLHSPKFKIDEEALKTSVGTLSYLALQFLNKVDGP